MTDETTKTPGEQDLSPDRQAGDTPTTDWEARFKGLQRTFDTLVKSKGDLETRLADMTSAKEQLEKQTDMLSIDKESAVQKHQTKIDELTNMLTEKETTLSQLAQMQLKVEVANELGHPELIQLIDAIPGSDDKTVVEKAMKDIIGFTNAQVKQRETQLSEGLMPGETADSGGAMPTTEQGWVELIDRQPLGSDEYNKAMDQYFKFTMRE